MKLSEYIKKFGDGALVGIYDEKQIKQMSGVGKVKYIAIVEEDKVWLPKKNEKFWYISIFGHVCSLVSDKREVENILEIQQVYRTEAEAEFARDKAIFLEFMRKEFLRNSDVIDWLEGDCYCMAYDFTYKEVIVRYNAEIKTSLFNTNDFGWLKEFTDKHEDDIKKYYFEVVE